MYVSLIDGSTQATFAALISPDGTTSPADDKYTDITVQGFTPGDTNHPLQFDTYHQNWYLRVTAATSGDANVNGTTGYKGIHYHLGNESFYANSLFTGSSYMQRISCNHDIVVVDTVCFDTLPIYFEIFVYDFFTGEECDVSGNWGSPLIILNELVPYQDNILNENLRLNVVLNDSDHDKIKKLTSNVILENYSFNIEFINYFRYCF